MRLPYRWQLVRVFFSAQFFQLVEDWPENVGIVIRSRIREIREVFCALNNRGDTLETHSSVDVTCSERDIVDATVVAAPGYRLRVELDENEVQAFDATRMIFIY